MSEPNAKPKPVSKHELWTLAGETAHKCEGLAAFIQYGGHMARADLDMLRGRLEAMAKELCNRRGPNPAERIPPRANAVGGRASAESKRRKDGAK